MSQSGRSLTPFSSAQSLSFQFFFLPTFLMIMFSTDQLTKCMRLSRRFFFHSKIVHHYPWNNFQLSLKYFWQNYHLIKVDMYPWELIYIHWPLYYEHLFSFLFAQIAYKLITYKQLTELKHLHMEKMTEIPTQNGKNGYKWLWTWNVC